MCTGQCRFLCQGMENTEVECPGTHQSPTPVVPLERLISTSLEDATGLWINCTQWCKGIVSRDGFPVQLTDGQMNGAFISSSATIARGVRAEGQVVDC